MIHPTALVSQEAQIDPASDIGAYVIIEGPVQIAAGCQILPHAHILGDTIIGEGTVVGRGAVIGEVPQDFSYSPATKSGVRIGRRNLIREHVTIHRGSKEGGLTEIGDENFLMIGAHLGHDVKMGNKNVLANNVLLGGHVQVGNNAFLGGGAVFHQFIRVGDACMIQGNSTITKDVPHFCAAARLNGLTGLNVIGLRRQGYDSVSRAEVKAAFSLMFRSGQNRSQALVTARQKSWGAEAEKFLAFMEGPSKKGICHLRGNYEAE